MSDVAKRNAAEAALKLVEPDMVLGLGTGSTAAIFVRLLAEKVSQGLKIIGTPTSEATDKLARSLGVKIVSPDELTRIDLTIDGADEFDPDLNLIKGGGAALAAREDHRRSVRPDGGDHGSDQAGRRPRQVPAAN